MGWSERGGVWGLSEVVAVVLRGATSSRGSGELSETQGEERGWAIYRPGGRALAGAQARRGSDLSPPGERSAWTRCMGLRWGPEASRLAMTGLAGLCHGGLWTGFMPVVRLAATFSFLFGNRHSGSVVELGFLGPEKIRRWAAIWA